MAINDQRHKAASSNVQMKLRNSKSSFSGQPAAISGRGLPRQRNQRRMTPKHASPTRQPHPQDEFGSRQAQIECR
jgi:hypothetical protein